MYDVNKIRKDFPMITNNQDMIYFDNAATSFKPQCVIDEVSNYYKNMNTNIHRGDYPLSYKVSKLYDDTREIVRSFINAKDTREIVFTSGATASINTIAHCYGSKFIKKDDVILITKVEHASNVLPWFEVSKHSKCKIEYIELNEDATFNINNYKKCFENNNVKLVAITGVSNVMGYVYPIKEICKIAHEHNAIVSIDGAQAVPHIEIDVQDMDIDFLSFSSHKMCGPNGVGVLYGKYDLLESMDPLMYGGGSNARFEIDQSVILKKTPEKYESGTVNIEGVLAFGKAIKYIESIGIKNIFDHDKQLTEYFISRLQKLDNVTLYNPKSEVGIVSFNINGIFSQDAASYFGKQGICVRSGNHCAKLLHNIIGANDTIRASFYFYNTKQEIDRFIDVIKNTTLEKCVESVL